jgi:hypothetical protein
MNKSFYWALVFLYPLVASGFGIIDISAINTNLHIIHSDIAPAVSSFSSHLSSNACQHFTTTGISSSSTAVAATTDAVSKNVNLLTLYKNILVEHPLPTKMITGGTLAVCGDAIAQSRTQDEYDKRRALSFAGFDCVYRAVQHFSFPIIVQHCQGQYIGAAVAATPGIATLIKALDVDNLHYYYGAVEQTLASQLGIVPFFYYPVFYTVTAFVQGLDADGAIQRAKDTFVPLMKRNLLFWIPVQFIQFCYIDENLQIPFLSVAGLMWTFIISLFAGNAKASVKNKTEDSFQRNSCTGGVEKQCEKEKAVVLR